MAECKNKWNKKNNKIVFLPCIGNMLYRACCISVDKHVAYEKIFCLIFDNVCYVTLLMHFFVNVVNINIYKQKPLYDLNKFVCVLKLSHSKTRFKYTCVL